MATKAAPDLPVGRRRGSGSQVPGADTFGDRMLAVYRLVRLPGAVAAGVGNLILTFAFDWVFGWLAVAAAAVALFDSIKELRSPRKTPAVTISVDATLLGLTMVAIGLPAVSFAFGLWVVLLTAVLASGWWRPFLYGYVALWAVLANLVTWSGVREWEPVEVLVLDWAALLLVGALVVVLFEVALRRVREMEAERDYMLGVVGHELGNALTSVTALASTLERRGHYLGPEETARMISSVRAQAQESADIADDLLTLARLRQRALTIEPELMDAWEETVEVANRTMETTGTHIEVPDRIPSPIVADPLRFRQVIRNLLLNAIEYGGEPISIELAVDGDWVVISVRDAGMGITTDELEAVFQPYGRASTTQSYRGAGLGLWISRRLAEQMEGGLGYRREGGLTIFDVRFSNAEAIHPGG